MKSDRSNTALQAPPAARYRRRRTAAVLLEVMVALTILGVGLTVVMRSFTLALKATRREKAITTGAFLANYMVNQYQVMPPYGVNYDEGDFGEDYPGYTWEMIVESEEPRYDVDSDRLYQEKFFRRRLIIRVWYQSPYRSEPTLAAEVDTFLLGLEQFSDQTKQQLQLFREMY